MARKSDVIDIDQVVLLIAERLRDKATEQGRIPFDTGDLRKSIQVEHLGHGRASVGSNLAYARAVHDGRPAITIKPNIEKNPPRGGRKRAKRWYRRNPGRARLKFQIGGRTVFARQVRQPARKGNPFLLKAAAEMQREGWDWIVPILAKDVYMAVARNLAQNLRLKKGGLFGTTRLKLRL